MNETLYNNLNKKLENLRKQATDTPQNTHKTQST